MHQRTGRALPVFDQLDPLALARRAQAERQADLVAAAGAADAVDMHFGVLGDIDVDDGIDGADVEAARGDVGGDQHRATAVGELHQQFVAVALLQFAVQGQRRNALRAQLVGQFAAMDAGIAEGQRRLGPEVGQQVRDGVVALFVRALRRSALRRGWRPARRRP